jgi:DNA-binding transcriptional regulator YhcF (GntR family)
MGSLNAYNFTEGVRVALVHARAEAKRQRHGYVGTEHLLLGLTRDESDETTRLLARLGTSPDVIRREVLAAVKEGRAMTTGPDLPYTSRAKKVLELAISAARERNDNYVGCEHLLLGLLDEEKGVAAQVLNALGVTAARARSALSGDLAAQFEVQVDDTSDRSIYEQIVSRIQEGVATGKLNAGDRLPTVRRLADDLDIAPGTVARAYGELERLGVVVTEGARGTRVAAQKPPGMPDAERPQTLAGLLRPVAVAGFHLGATAAELRTALEAAMRDIFDQPAAEGSDGPR